MCYSHPAGDFVLDARGHTGSANRRRADARTSAALGHRTRHLSSV